MALSITTAAGLAQGLRGAGLRGERRHGDDADAALVRRRLLFRWRFQFSIRSLLILTMLIAVPCSWLAVEMKAGEERAGGGGGDHEGGRGDSRI